jgi:hypothetical protein
VFLGASRWPPQIVIRYMPELLPILQQLQSLLTVSDNPGQAKVIAKLMELHSTDATDFNRLLHSVDMWGGSGAVWEVGPSRMDSAQVRSFRDNIIALADWMDAGNMGFERSRFIAGVFRKWNAMGI